MSNLDGCGLKLSLLCREKSCRCVFKRTVDLIEIRASRESDAKCFQWRYTN